jgi:uncharacterized surface protein with fasciclin (FAS1) repeats
MKHPLIAMGLLGLLGTTSIIGWVKPVHAANSNVEAALQSYGDLSMFYQALLNTGVINELNENEHYTIFAPTNAAFAEIRQQNYPCFYAVECRPQIAELLRNHIIQGRHDLADLDSYGYGIKTMADRRVHVEEAYVNDFSVEGRKIMSKTDVGGDVIYRLNGVISTPQELAQFSSVQYVPTAAYVPDSSVTERTVTRKVYHTAPISQAYPAGDMASPVYGNDGSTTVITNTYTTEQQ